MTSKPDSHLIIGTAGHVDHGKTELIKALTGVDTDRLQEEKERGITIDLGFAPLKLSDGRIAGVVDVPGHERFISNMLAGIGGIDLVLLVVDVNEGVMPQTREHLQILELLRIQRGVIVLTKCDLAEKDWIDLVEAEVREKTANTFLKDAPLVRVSAVTREGLPELVTTIQEQATALEPKDAAGPFRLPVDRHFTMSGFGTIITGTALSGTVRVGDMMEFLPLLQQFRVREIQVHGAKVEAACAGQRIALNLAGLDRSQIKRGSVIGTPGIFEMTERVDARLSLLKDAPRPLKFRDPVHFYLGTARVVGIVALLDCDQMAPGESALVQIHLDRPLVAHRQDLFIIRSYSPMTTIGGGVIIDSNPTRHKRFRDEVIHELRELESGERSFLLQKITEHQCVKLKEIEMISGMSRDRIAEHLEALENDEKLIKLADQWATAESVRSWNYLLVEKTGDFHRNNPLLPGISRAALKGFLPGRLSQKAFDQVLQKKMEESQLTLQDDTVHLSDFKARPSEEQMRSIEKIEKTYLELGLNAKNNREMVSRIGLSLQQMEACFAWLFSQKILIKLNEESYLHMEAYRKALQALHDHFSRKETLTLAEFRDLLGSSRKQVQALLEYFDALKYTLRKDDYRVSWKLPPK